jgi:hypothetical protein
MADDIPEALTKLKSAVEHANPSATMSKSNDSDEAPVSLKNRALPLIELLTAAANENCDVMWKIT